MILKCTPTGLQIDASKSQIVLSASYLSLQNLSMMAQSEQLAALMERLHMVV
jgi:hypothetical protein